MKVKVINGFGKAKLENKELYVSQFNGEYTLTVKGFTHKSAVTNELCAAKRLSTINKYAAAYGVEFTI